MRVASLRLWLFHISRLRGRQNDELILIGENLNLPQVNSEHLTVSSSGKPDLVVYNVPFTDKVAQRIVFFIVEEEEVR